MICTIKSKNRTELIDITSKIQDIVLSSGIRHGLCMLYVPHTTAAITINESADPSVKEDILMIINTIIPWKAGYRHLEGNSPAHIKSTLIGPSELIAVENDRLILGTWQGIFFCEFDGPRTRKVHVRLIKETFQE
ncbi:MAG: secondary thiamine-phosphate synthase enzyme YjbQ [Desulfobacteraceae bacterium]|nr:secondary thiamine-phosphate synthase enzyme YjbQ [Desulfobacteraceae bacterium]MDH3572105.1 secondary thiamine-phosphate synthase enzyme YjbQ [Desulfobacteraceae bacterium]MDH3720806.1 secondary thiamine-phosphate synthase enzyme YjbQ [Desulfobacteraceae bacterium]MDH3835166.1 secondary thiamine-phosphate synthase enzyme YjbQ [Desulfobacteraceae bacterium]MDH3872536.1 secondary thiamine-phosphate synthase enzyme YjbQ [Desulfobacteraceae bacterium]